MTFKIGDHVWCLDCQGSKRHGIVTRYLPDSAYQVTFPERHTCADFNEYELMPYLAFHLIEDEYDIQDR